MRTLRSALALAVITVTAIAVPAPAMAIPLGPPYNALTLSGEAQGSPLYGQNLSFDDGNATISMASWGPVGVNFTVTNADHNWQILGQPPTGSDWVAGTTYVSGDSPTATNASWDVGGNGSGCSQWIDGSLTVHEFARDPGTQAITKFAATFNVPCDTRPNAAVGELRWHSSVGYKAIRSWPTGITNFGVQTQGMLGPEKSIILTSTGSESVTLGSISLGGPFAGSFEVGSENCSGVILVRANACEIQVRARAATTFEIEFGYLEIQDDTSSGRKYFPLVVTGGYSNVTISPTLIDFGAVDVGTVSAPKQITISATGTTGAEVGMAAIGSEFGFAFDITADTCSGTTVQPGQSCTITVVAQPPMSGDLYTSVYIPVNGQNYSSALKAKGQSFLGRFHPVPLARFLDTRTGLGAPAAKIGPGGTLDLQITGRLDVSWIPSSAKAIVMNVTVNQPTSEGYVTAFPAGIARPNASSLNFTTGWTGANSVTTGLSANGKVSFYNSAGTTHLIVDVVGYYADEYGPNPGGLFHPIEPGRLYDSRDDGGKVQGGGGVRLGIDFGPVQNPHIRALAINLTAINSDGWGYLTAWNGLGQPPLASNLNYGPGEVVPNMAIVQASPWDGYPSIGIYTTTTTHMFVDVVGYFDDDTIPGGLRFHPIAPTRITDTRTGLGATGPLGPNQTVSIATGTVTNAETIALAMNVTAVAPSTYPYITVWANGTDQPGVSNLNPVPGRATPNAVITLLGTDNKFNIFNSAGNTHVLADVVGTYYFLYVPTGFTANIRSANGGGTPYRPKPVTFTLHRVG